MSSYWSGSGATWDRLKSLAQDTDWKKLQNYAQTAVKHVGTGIDRAIGVPGEANEGLTAQQQTVGKKVTRKLNVKRRSSTSSLEGGRRHGNSSQVPSSSNEVMPTVAQKTNESERRQQQPLKQQNQHGKTQRHDWGEDTRGNQAMEIVNDDALKEDGEVETKSANYPHQHGVSINKGRGIHKGESGERVKHQNVPSDKENRGNPPPTGTGVGMVDVSLDGEGDEEQCDQNAHGKKKRPDGRERGDNEEEEKEEERDGKEEMPQLHPKGGSVNDSETKDDKEIAGSSSSSSTVTTKKNAPDEKSEGNNCAGSSTDNHKANHHPQQQQGHSELSKHISKNHDTAWGEEVANNTQQEVLPTHAHNHLNNHNQPIEAAPAPAATTFVPSISGKEEEEGDSIEVHGRKLPAERKGCSSSLPNSLDDDKNDEGVKEKYSVSTTTTTTTTIKTDNEDGADSNGAHIISDDGNDVKAPKEATKQKGAGGPIGEGGGGEDQDNEEGQHPVSGSSSSNNDSNAAADIDPITLEILSQAKEEYEKLESYTNQIEEQNKALRKSLEKAKSVEGTLAAREQQIESLSRENARVSEENGSLKDLLGGAEDRNKTLLGKISILTSKLSEITKLKQQLKDKDKALERSQRALGAKEKDVKLAIMEGQKMSKKQHGKDVLIRSLRKELEAQQHKIEKQGRELDAKISDANNAQNRAKAASSEAEETTSKLSLLTKKNLVISDRLLEAESQAHKYQQLATEHAKIIKTLRLRQRGQDSKIKKIFASLNERKKEKEELQGKLDSLEKEKDRFVSLYENSRRSLKDAEVRSHQKEEAAASQEKTLQKQMQDLRQKAHEADLRNQELAEAIPSATQPLLRQIKMLTSNAQSTKEQWLQEERRYKAEIVQRKGELKKAQADSAKKDMVMKRHRQLAEEATERLSKSEERYKKLQMDYKEECQKAVRLERDLKTLRDETNDLKANRENLSKQRERAEEKLQQLLVSTRLEQNKLRQTLQLERRRRKEIANQLKSLRARVATATTTTASEGKSNNAVSLTTAVAAAANDKISGTLHRNNNNSNFDGVKQTPESEEQVMLTSLRGDVVINGGARSSSNNNDKSIELNSEQHWQVMEKLRSENRRKDGELFSLRQRMAILEEHRKILSDKLHQLTTANAENETKLQDAEKVERELKELNTKYYVVVDLLGEREEELHHAKEDLEHVKDTFRKQVESLLDQIEKLRASGSSSSSRRE